MFFYTSQHQLAINSHRNEDFFNLILQQFSSDFKLPLFDSDNH